MRNATYATALTLMIGWLIWIGKPVLIPVIAAAISVYVLSTAAESMQALPVVGRLPAWARRVTIQIAAHSCCFDYRSGGQTYAIAGSMLVVHSAQGMSLIGA